MKAHVICVNDSIEAVVLDDIDLANKKMDELKQKHYTTICGNYDEEYGNVYFWHIHDVPILGQKTPGEPYLKDDHKWYIDLSTPGETSMGEAGPYNIYEDAVARWNEYIKWCSAMDVN